MPTLADVAKLAGVGVMSVSRVVNGTRRVSPEVEQRVRAAIKKIGYQPNEAARVLKGTRGSVLGLIVPDLADPFYASCVSAIQETAWEAGYMTLVAASSHREDMERRETELMVQRRVAGLLVVPIGAHNGHFAAAQNAGVPVVAIDRPIAHVESDAVIVDNLEASLGATRHLIEHGHREIVCVADDERIYTRNQRVLGYSKAMREAGLPPRVCTVGPMTGSVADQLPLFLASSPAATALFAASNHVGTDVLRFVQQHGICMPGELAFVCFDDFSAATLVTPTITVVQQPVTEIGQKGASMLLGRLKESNGREPVRITLATKFVTRKSCGC